MTSVSGAPRLWLRLEGLVVLAAAVVAYARLVPGRWGLFAILFLAPDLAALGYLMNARVGAALYNIAHTYVAPALLLAAAFGLPSPDLLAPGLIWAAHIGLDRALGYGLKYPSAFQDTHLGGVGRARTKPEAAHVERMSE